MLQNPLQIRLEKFAPWQHVTFMTCLCERMYPNYAMFCEQTEFADPQAFRAILDRIWESLTVKSAKVNFENELEKLEELFPNTSEYEFYGVYPAVDACVGLSTLLHALLDKDTLFEATIELSQHSISTVAQLEVAQGSEEITNDNQKDNQAVCEEWDVQWAIYRPIKESEERDVQLIKDLRTELRDDGVSNIGVSL
ncbi:hypothetical protein ST37_08090 [Vibrio sp. qd031]|uniref:YjaG family protein n=1 Tax=Vibrio sp. qd031 TaxID=1603038 RepID=UPI000A1188FF|nr:DUF416 family protein [Vibrio sp. qd031]ORT50675.1 hypothetical protein ST37_08090 [Vibrio sp. qd031]